MAKSVCSVIGTGGRGIFTKAPTAINAANNAVRIVLINAVLFIL